MEYERVDKQHAPSPTKRPTAEQAEYDAAIADLKSEQPGFLLAVTVPPEGNEKSMRTKFAYAARRARVQVRSWYDQQTAKVYVERK